ncbi:MAG: glycosyltransferase family 39 protein [Myxococcota bacterium]
MNRLSHPTEHLDRVDARSLRSARASLLFAVVALFLAALLPRLFSRGMFVDGITYAAIARNLALGRGSFWKPFYTQTLYPVFVEHPPLALWLESLAFRLVGDARHIEALYSLVCGLLLCLLVVALWRALDLRDHAGSWFALLLLALVPLTSWMFANNMLENTMVLFTSAALVLFLHGQRTPSTPRALAWGFAAGLAVVAAFLSKGPVGLFPLAWPAVTFAVWPQGRRRQTVAVAAGALAALTVAVIAMASSAEASTSLLAYLRTQVAASISGRRIEAHTARYYIVLSIVSNLAIPVLTSVALKLHQRTPLRYERATAALGLLALLASLPIALSGKQSAWYAYPSYPVYAVFLAVLFGSAAARGEKWFAASRQRRQWLVYGSVVVVVVALVAGVLDRHNVRKQRAFHADFTSQPVAMPTDQLVTVCPPELMTDWSLHANFMRTFQASLTDQAGAPWYLRQVQRACQVPAGCVAVHPPQPQTYERFRCSKGR